MKINLFLGTLTIYFMINFINIFCGICIYFYYYVLNFTNKLIKKSEKLDVDFQDLDDDEIECLSNCFSSLDTRYYSQRRKTINKRPEELSDFSN